VPLHLPKILYILAWDGSLASMVRGPLLTPQLWCSPH
jgi:hypothetical protein